jgi:5-methylcytosine-specific restriction endonuclease McrA
LEFSGRKIGDLKWGDEWAWIVDWFSRGLRQCGVAEEEIADKAKDLRANRDSVTLGSFVKLVKELHEAHVSLSEAGATCPPPKACGRCGESTWTLDSVSPNRRSAQWKCEYCSRIEVVKREDVERRAVREGREPVPREVQREVWRRDQGKCVACGSQECLEFDHIIAVARGGANTARNIQLLCQECNREKSDAAPGER